MSLEETELTIGGTKLRGVWIAIVLSIGTTLAGGIWAVAEFYGRIESVEAAVAGNGDTAEKLTVLGTNLETIMENQSSCLTCVTVLPRWKKQPSRTIYWFNSSKKRWTVLVVASRKSTVRLMISGRARRSV